MLVKAATATSSLQIHCEGDLTDTARAVLGDVLRDSTMRPGTGRIFTGFELEFTVTYNTATAVVDLSLGTAGPDVGLPVIHKGADGLDWEGAPLSTDPTGVRALLIQDVSGTGTRKLELRVDDMTILVPQGGSLLMQAPQGGLLPGVWNEIKFMTDMAATTARVKVTALLEVEPA